MLIAGFVGMMQTRWLANLEHHTIKRLDNLRRQGRPLPFETWCGVLLGADTEAPVAIYQSDIRTQLALRRVLDTIPMDTGRLNEVMYAVLSLNNRDVPGDVVSKRRREILKGLAAHRLDLAEEAIVDIFKRSPSMLSERATMLVPDEIRRAGQMKIDRRQALKLVRDLDGHLLLDQRSRTESQLVLVSSKYEGKPVQRGEVALTRAEVVPGLTPDGKGVTMRFEWATPEVKPATELQLLVASQAPDIGVAASDNGAIPRGITRGQALAIVKAEKLGGRGWMLFPHGHPDRRPPVAPVVTNDSSPNTPDTPSLLPPSARPVPREPASLKRRGRPSTDRSRNLPGGPSL